VNNMGAASFPFRSFISGGGYNCALMTEEQVGAAHHAGQLCPVCCAFCNIIKEMIL